MFPDIGSVGHGSVGLKKKTMIVVERREPKINMAEKLVGVISKLRQCGEKGSTTETPMRHKNGLKTSLSIFF